MTAKQQDNELYEALAALLATALKVNDRAWADAVDRAGTDRPCDRAAAALAERQYQSIHPL